MPRLFRKFDPTKSTILQSKKRFFSGNNSKSQISKFDNNKSYMSGEGYGSQRTYLCIKSLRQRRESAEKKRLSIGKNEVEAAFTNLED